MRIISKGSVSSLAPLIGYKLSRGTDILPNSSTNSIPEEAGGYINLQDGGYQSPIADGWYITELYESGIDEVTGTFEKIVNGKVVTSQTVIKQAVSPVYPCGTHGFDDCI